MKSPCRAPSACLELDYVRDTSSAPLSQRVECEVQLAPLQLGGRQGLQLHIAPPLPKKLDRSHSLAFVWEGKAYHGVVRHHGKCGDGGIKLLLELQ